MAWVVSYIVDGEAPPPKESLPEGAQSWRLIRCGVCLSAMHAAVSSTAVLCTTCVDAISYVRALRESEDAEARAAAQGISKYLVITPNDPAAFARLKSIVRPDPHPKEK